MDEAGVPRGLEPSPAARFAGWLLAGPADALAWRRVVYLPLAFPLGLAYFVFLVTVLAVGLALVITFAGVPILVGAMWAWRGLAGLERRLAGTLLGVEIARPYRSERGGRFPARIGARLRDPATWKDLVYLFAHFPLGIAWFAITVSLLSATFALLGAPILVGTQPGGWDLGFITIRSVPAAFALVPLGALVGLVSLRILDALGALHGAFARLMLGASPDPALTEEVSDLRTQQARIIAAADEARRKLERDLHDGAQQRLVALSLALGLARQRLERGEDASDLVARAGGEVQQAIDDLRILARGLHPALLADRGLAPALQEVAARASVPVTLLAAPEERLTHSVEATAYFLVSEALTNVAKYAEATRATVSARVEGEGLVVEVADDGVGGADPTAGSGLRGLRDRVSALNGRLEIDSPAGAGTRLRATLPVTATLPVSVIAEAEAEAPAVREAVVESLRRRRRLETHTIVFAVVQTALVVLWLATGAGYFWPGWAIFGWGIALALHAALALGRTPITEGTIARERERVT